MMETAQRNQQYKRKIALRNVAIILFAAVALVLALLISANAGYSKLSFYETLCTLMGNGTEKQELVVFSFRLPRIIISALIGAGLALSGCILQGVTQNPLADASLLGITAGGGLAVVLYTMFIGTSTVLSIFTLPVLSFMGAGVAASIVYMLAYRGQVGVSTLRLILTGIAVQAGFSALTTVLVVQLDETQYDFVASWQAGMIWGANWKFVLAILPWLILLIPYVFYKANTLDALSLGYEMATGLGVCVEVQQRRLLIASVSLAACSVAVGGNISFVGLIAPHMARRLVGPRHRTLVPVCALIGAVLVTVADTIGRIVIQPTGLPTGVVTAMIGAPYFIYLLANLNKGELA